MERFNLQGMNKKLEDWIDKNPKIFKSENWKKLEKTSALPGPYLLVILVVVAFLLVLLVGGRNLLSNLIGVVYPIVCSLNAINSPEKSANLQWLSYWIVFMFFKIVERLLGPLLRLIPLFFLIKIFFFVWCYHPATKGATDIYNEVVRRFLLGILGISETKSPVVRPPSPPKSSEPEAPLGPSVGDLKVTVKEAEDLTVMDLFDGTTNAYCVLKLQPAPGKEAQSVEKVKFKTTCKHKTTNPVWNEPVKMDGLPSLDSSLVVTVKNKQAVGLDDFIGSVTIPVSEIARTETSDTWYTLADPEKINVKNVQGKLHLAISFSNKV